MAPMLTVDLGNSRLKALHWRPRAGGFEPESSWDGEQRSLDDFARYVAGLTLEAAALASVAGPELTARVRGLLEERCERVLLQPPCGLENRCRQPERVGADRLYAARGAADLCGGACVVVDAGTALTVDAVAAEGALRVFLGGAIAPGPELLATALAQGTARLPRVLPRPGARALGRVTEDAIEAGIVVGFRGAARRLVEEISAEADLDGAPVLLTGGARDFLLRPEPFLGGRPVTVSPELVHRGLFGALRDALEG
jgi:type III pantothenate kinase